MSADDGTPSSDRLRELAAEQAHIDRAYAALDRLRETGDATVGPTPDDAAAGGTHQERFERELATADSRRRAAELRWGDPPLVFGRLDRRAGDRFHIGRIGVFDDAHDPLVVDWRAPVAEPFYRATRADPLGVHRRRSFRCRGRHLLDIDDVVLDGTPDGAVVGEAALLNSLSEPRTGRMSSHVATVQAEQDEIIRAPMAGITLVQGGAGTGKTVVALHRAAYLLYTHRDVLDRQGVLILGPTTRFLDYVRDVLPELGEHDAELAVVGDLFPGVAGIPEVNPAVATVKADLRMARLIHRAVRTRQRHLRRPAEIPVGRFVLKLDEAVVNAIVDAARAAPGTHNQRRRAVARHLSAALYREFQRRNVAPRDRMRDPGRTRFVTALEDIDAYRVLLERIWPVLDPQTLLADLFGSAALIRAAAGTRFSDAEQRLLLRPRARDPHAVSWTDADVPLLHEAFAHLGPVPRPEVVDAGIDEDVELMVDRVIDHVRLSLEQGMDEVMERDLRQSVLGEVQAAAGIVDEPPPDDPTIPRVWGTVLVDEAQDISPMAWRMITRSCPNQAMTIVGDLAQGTRPWSPRSWDDVVAWIDPRHRPRRHDLHVNYRTPTEVMRLAAPLSADPSAATAVRGTGRAPRLRPTENVVATTVDVVADALAGDPERSIGVVAAPACVPVLVEALDAAWEQRPRQERQRLAARVQVHDPESVKGLEFDEVIVVEPADVAGGVRPDAALYIALTRTVAGLQIVHARPLPAPLADGVAQEPSSSSA